MHASRKFRAPPMMRRQLTFPGTNPPPPAPNFSDVMKALSQIQQNQTQILNVINAIVFNQWNMLLCESSMAITLAPNQNVANGIESEFQDAWSQMVNGSS
jgi:hypothetical protein